VPLIRFRLVCFVPALCLMAIGSPALAQTANPNDAPAIPSKEEPPPGGCMPIGVTASGEVVFPFLCRNFIEQHRAANEQPPALDKPVAHPAAEMPASPQKPVAAETPPAAEKTAATEDARRKAADADGKNAESVAAEKPASAQKPAVAETPPVAEKAAAAEDNPKAPDAERKNVAEGKSTGSVAAAEHKDTATNPSDATADELSTAAVPAKRAEKKKKGSLDCKSFRSYDAASSSYRDYSGHVRPCRVGP
jgi:hypothetical protein